MILGMNINQKQDSLIAEFDLYDDRLDKIQLLIGYGKQLPEMPKTWMTSENRIPGCQSIVWLNIQLLGNCLFFSADAEPSARIAKGMIALLTMILSGEHAHDIAKAELYFVERIGMNALVASSRMGGLASMIERIQTFAKHAV